MYKTYRVVVPVVATYAVSGVPTRDATQAANLKAALIADARGKLNTHITAEFGDQNPVFEVTTSCQVLTAPTLVTNEDHSITRTPGLSKMTVVVTATPQK